ncbi:ubiquitin carboxyl-terminal hydrolase 10-like isoform X2 [Actinia tenebrosa]|uniref:Ubiquitin carboxyl-terminal hydrolase n=1 Tax=Actinia tenebrosa TaxID=6105 RepID=A0A6P8J086_ACTTE|nr:ubiquitin carboxyl-terminal hydrolase 10-like isoform X2 [Actinia tenebrosa]
MPNSVEGLRFGDFSVDDWEKILKDVSQSDSARPPVEFLFDYVCSEDDQVADDDKDLNVSREAHNKSVPTGPDDSGVEIGLESEQEGVPAKHHVPVVFVPNKNVVDEVKTLEEAGVELSFCGRSVIEDIEPTNNGSTYLQDAENFPPLGSLQTQDVERSRKRRRKRKQHQRSGDVPCSSSEDSDRDKSPASIVERVSRVRSGSGNEKGSGTTENKGENQGVSENAAKKAETGQENKKSCKEGHDASSTDSKSTTETVLSIGDSSSSPPQSDVDFHTNKLPQNISDTTTTTANNNTTETSSIPNEATNKPSNAAPVSLWADLFRKPSSKQPASKVETNNVVSTQKEAIKDNNVKKVESVPIVIDIAEDKRAIRIAETLKKLSLDYTHKPLFLRGLINKANWCYINATLQALLTCPPFFNLLRQLEPLKDKESTSTPILDSMVKFSHEFNILPKQANQGKNGKVEFRTGSSFEPNYVYKMLSTIQSSLSAKGRQEDAEEFLSCVLNGIHEEMLQLMKLLEPTTKAEPADSEQTVTDDPSVVAVNGQDIDKNDDDDDGDWEQVGPRNKSSITRMAIFPQSLVSDIFGGYLRSSLHQAGAKESANVEPFFDLQLDIQNVSCIEDALNHLAVKEELQGYTCSKTNAQIDISKRVTFESLPKILILHLKRFIYSKSGSQKLLKHVDYPLDLPIGKELLSPNVKNKYSIAQKSYKLIAVVYHHGKTACGGHYTTDMCHPIHGWVRADDTKLKSVPVNHVLKPIQGKDPYLLYYCRTDQMA